VLFATVLASFFFISLYLIGLAFVAYLFGLATSRLSIKRLFAGLAILSALAVFLVFLGYRFLYFTDGLRLPFLLCFAALLLIVGVFSCFGFFMDHRREK
jgi:uncharacterized protein (DUF486 family)